MASPDYDALIPDEDCVIIDDDLLSDTEEIALESTQSVPICIDGENRVWAKAGVFSSKGGVISKNISESFPNERNPAFNETHQKDNIIFEDFEVSDEDEPAATNPLDITFLGSNSVVTVKATAPPVSSADGTFRCRNFPGDEIFSDAVSKRGLRQRNTKKPDNHIRSDDLSEFVGRMPKVRGKIKENGNVTNGDAGKLSYNGLSAEKIWENQSDIADKKSCKNSDDSDTDTEEITLIPGELESLTLESSIRDSGEGNTDLEIFSDDEYARGKICRKVKCSENDNEKNDQGAATDEEDIDMLMTPQNEAPCKQQREFTDYEENGGIKQVTKVKTETSVKVVEGEPDQGDGDDGMSRTTTRTTTRIITTVTTQGGEEIVTEHQDGGGDDLRSSMEAVLTQFMSSDGGATSDQQSATKHDE